jgi:hypothetical protein
VAIHWLLCPKLKSVPHSVLFEFTILMNFLLSRLSFDYTYLWRNCGRETEWGCYPIFDSRLTKVIVRSRVSCIFWGNLFLERYGIDVSGNFDNLDFHVGT